MVLSSFHPSLARWFRERVGKPSPPQVGGWPLIRSGQSALIAAPTGTGKTLAAFFAALDDLVRAGPDLPDETRVLYVSPLRALSNDIQKNLERPIREIEERDPSLPRVRVSVRTGDTSARDRAAMSKTPPHVLVTTPESFYILLGSAGGRALLRTVRTVIIDEIHALCADKRGAHLALSLERLEQLVGAPLQRIGLSATQKPLPRIARFLAGVGADGADRPCAILDIGHRRDLDLDTVVPDSPLAAVCSHEQWAELHAKMSALIRAHRSTLVFVGTRKLAERLAARLSESLGREHVACHHGSLSKELRLDAEGRLKRGALKALVATASLELGLDIGDVDLVLQIGSPRRIATLLQRVGRAGHGVDRTPKGRLFPLTLDEGVEAIAALSAVHRGSLDLTETPRAALDILAQQIVAACVNDDWREDELYDLFRRAEPYRDVTRADFDALIALHSSGRAALLHRDAVGGRVLGTKRARLAALMSGGAIPDNADYRVIVEPEGTFVGTINEDFAVESTAGDVFQLGNASWRVEKVERGTMRVSDARGAPPSLPFWLGEAPARSRELSIEVSRVREHGHDPRWIERESGVGPELSEQIAEYLTRGARELGGVPTVRRFVLERFFDESGGMQLVLHAPLGSRANKALGLALRKRICRSFGFELQAAANEEAIVLSLGRQHSFPLEEVYDYVKTRGARELLVQALLAAPMFMTRWRWNASRSLMLTRNRGGQFVPPQIQRMRAEDLLAQAFPDAIACGETLAPGDIVIPEDHPIVAQTIEDCLHEALDIDAFLQVLADLESGSIERLARDTTEPSVFAHGILNAAPYAFLDDAPLEERRTQAVRARRAPSSGPAEQLARLDPDAIARVRHEAWPAPESAEEVHQALGWMGYATDGEIEPWRVWIDELHAARRVACASGRWYAVEASREPMEIARGRLEATGPVFDDDDFALEFRAELAALEGEGAVLRTTIDGRAAWCARHLLARIHRYTLDRLRIAIEPSSPIEFQRFLARWQHAAEETRLEGPRGVSEVVQQLAGFQIPAEVFERQILPLRVRGFQTRWLDELAFAGEIAWGRLWGAGRASARHVQITIVPRAELASWLALADAGDRAGLRGDASAVIEQLASRGASFAADLARDTRLLPNQLEEALAELTARGLVTCDSPAGLRALATSKLAARKGRDPRRVVPIVPGRWSLWRGERGAGDAEFLARALLRRYGVVFIRLLGRETLPLPWRDVVRALRTLEARGEVHGGRFVAGISGEQYATPEAVRALRASKRAAFTAAVTVDRRDPLDLRGILTPERERGRGRFTIAAHAIETAEQVELMRAKHTEPMRADRTEPMRAEQTERMRANGTAPMRADTRENARASSAPPRRARARSVKASPAPRSA